MSDHCARQTILAGLWTCGTTLNPGCHWVPWILSVPRVVKGCPARFSVVQYVHVLLMTICDDPRGDPAEDESPEGGMVDKEWELYKCRLNPCILLIIEDVTTYPQNQDRQGVSDGGLSVSVYTFAR